MISILLNRRRLMSGKKVVQSIAVVDLGNGTVIFLLPEDADGGTINILAGGNEYQTTVSSGGVAVIDFGHDLTPGTYEIEYSYSGNRLYLPSPTCYATISAPKYVTDISISVEDAVIDEVIGVGYIDVCAYLPTGASGPVTFTLENGSSDTANVTDGQARIHLVDTSGLSAGTHTVTASYSGDENWAPASDTTEFYAKYQTNMNMNGVSVSVGKKFIVRVNINQSATGTITLTIPNYYSESVQILNGVAKFIVDPNPLPAGSYTATATYSGDNYYTSSSKTASIDVAK